MHKFRLFLRKTPDWFSLSPWRAAGSPARKGHSVTSLLFSLYKWEALSTARAGVMLIRGNKTTTKYNASFIWSQHHDTQMLPVPLVAFIGQFSVLENRKTDISNPAHCTILLEYSVLDCTVGLQYHKVRVCILCFSWACYLRS